MLALVSSLLLAAANVTPGTVDPYLVYASAQAYWLNQPYAPYLSYDVAVQVAQGSAIKLERYDTLLDATTPQETIAVNPISDYELQHPVVPHGMNVCIIVTCLSKPLAPIDFIGIPELSPTYSFGMAPFVRQLPPDEALSDQELVARVRAAFHDPYPSGRAPLPGPMPSTLPTIAHILAQAREAYSISYAGEADVTGHRCYHLILVPLRNPGRYRLRDLWIDETTDATWRLRIGLNFVDGPGTTVPWTVDFDNINGVQYVGRETAERPMRYEGQTYSQAMVSFENIQAPDSLEIPLGYGAANPVREPQL